MSVLTIPQGWSGLQTFGYHLRDLVQSDLRLAAKQDTVGDPCPLPALRISDPSFGKKIKAALDPSGILNPGKFV
jgi:hypothetical protein